MPRTESCPARAGSRSLNGPDLPRAQCQSSPSQPTTADLVREGYGDYRGLSCDYWIIATAIERAKASRKMKTISGSFHTSELV